MEICSLHRGSVPLLISLPHDGEELPSDVRGRVFGVLNTLVSLASFLPILIVGPVADIIGTPAVILISAGVVESGSQPS